MLRSWWLPVVLLLVSNIFMTYAWYGHLKKQHLPMWQAIGVSWGVAFFEYCLMVPANRWGRATYDPYQLKIMQEVITLLVFIGFAFLYFGIRPRWNHVAAFACIVGAVLFTVLPDRSR